MQNPSPTARGQSARPRKVAFSEPGGQVVGRDRWTALLVFAFLIGVHFFANAADLVPDKLRCEYRINPVGLDQRAPRLSWLLASTARAQKQTAYQIIAASSAEALQLSKGDLWDTGKVASDQTTHLVYAGKALQSRMSVWWKVRVWDKTGQVSDWSAPASWSMGLLDKSDWKARWIADARSASTVAPRGPLNGYHSQFATNADTVKWVMISLEKMARIDGIRLHPARPYDWQPDTPGFLFPLRFKIDAAQKPDFSDARVLVDRSSSDEPNPGTNSAHYRFPAVDAQFVRLSVTRLRQRDTTNYAVALAELEILSGEQNVAQGMAVTALDSIETGSWAQTNLTDGVLTSVKPEAAAGALPATMVRKSFDVNGEIKRATAYASALGLYELRLNGRRVGDELLSPEWTSYRKRVQYQVYDVTRLLRPGDNAVAAFLGEGWYAGRLMAVGPFPYGSYPRFLLQLEIEFTDGRQQTIASDGTWGSTTAGPIVSAGIYDGEVYDARKEIKQWDLPAAPGSQAPDANIWTAVKEFDLGEQQLVWQRNEPIRVVKELTPLSMTEPKPGVFIFDLGQNMVGWCRVRVPGKAGQRIVIRHGEMLDENGQLYTANLRGAPQVDAYIPAADGELVWEPRFTYHGFRFVELTGVAGRPTTNSVLGRVFHSASREVGEFHCSDPSLNQLMRNILWTQRANLMSSPNDCPQRDERFGWMGDIQAFSQTAIFNMDLAAFLTKFVQDMRDDQAADGRYPDFAPHPGDPNKSFSGVPAWGDAGTIVPFRMYENYGDTRILAEHFESARRWVEYIHNLNPDLVWRKGRNNDYNDWLNGDWVKQAGWPTTGGSVPKEVFATAFFAHSTDLVARMADVLGRKDEASRYGELFRRIKAAFIRDFVKPDGRIEGDTQGGYALALNFNLLPEELRSKAAEHLVQNIRKYQNHLSTGIQTTHRAMLELTRIGHNDLAWQLVTNRTFPSWLYMIDNGATTIWERWDGYVKGRGFQDAGMNSFNHWAFGSVGEWIWRNVAGINHDPEHPGYEHFVIRVLPGGGVTSAKASYDSIRGKISSQWQIAGGTITLKVGVPPNTAATVYVPASSAADVLESGTPAGYAEGVRFTRADPDAAVFEVGSGDYEFSARFGQK